MSNKVNILGVRFDSAPRDALLRKIQILIKEKKKFYIVTPNSEQVLLAGKDEKFRRILNEADISLPDGTGIVAAYKYLSLPDKESFFKKPALFLQGLKVGLSVVLNRKWLEKDLKVIRGREFFLDLIALANKKNWKVYLLGGEGAEAAGTKRKLENSYKNLVLSSAPGPLLDYEGLPPDAVNKKIEESVVGEINSFKPELLFVAFGAPKQEKWIKGILKKLDVGGAMVVGVTFKYIEGSAKLPPKWLADAGLEWLWRLFTGSQKLSRVLKAFPAFPLAVYRYKSSR